MEKYEMEWSRQMRATLSSQKTAEEMLKRTYIIKGDDGHETVFIKRNQSEEEVKKLKA